MREALAREVEKDLSPSLAQLCGFEQVTVLLQASVSLSVQWRGVKGSHLQVMSTWEASEALLLKKQLPR